MIDYTNTDIEKISVHAVGNKTNGELLQTAKSMLDISEPRVSEMLFKYFLKPLESPEFFSFSFTNNDFTLNPIFKFACQIFDDAKGFHRTTINIAKHLYELSIHPQIKSGDLFVAYFSDINIDDEVTDAVGIFKSENRQAFLKLNNNREIFTIQYDDGINIDKLDKGCLIFNTNRNTGFKVCIIDNTNKSSEAQFWRDLFLQLKPCSDDYHHTKQFMNFTKDFVTKKLSEDFEVTKTDQIDFLNRSVEYFKTHESFEKKDFEREVFQDTQIIKSFRSFEKSYTEINDIELESDFDISSQAVKKQSRIFKSVLKLDNNFHIYIHGNKELIEQGVEKNGRKYYKIYFENEK